MPAFGSVLVCDDVRRDTSNKDILIGVYSADIIVSQTPAWLTIALYVEYLPSELGEQKLTLRFGMVGAGLLGADIGINVTEVNPVALPIGGIQMLVQGETDFVIEASLDDKKTWQELKRKKIRIGQPPTASPLPTFAGRSATNP